MDQSQDYVIHSLEQHLFFARIMKEHALFFKAGLPAPQPEPCPGCGALFAGI